MKFVFGVYYYRINDDNSPWAVDKQMMEKDGWVFSEPVSTGQSYNIPGMSRDKPNSKHYIKEMIGTNGNKTVKLVLHHHSDGPYWST